MSDILTFLWAVINNWAGYSTGGLLVATVGFWAAWRDKPMPRTVLLIFSGLFFLMAIYKAWHDQYRSVRKLNEKLAEERRKGSPNLHGVIEMTMIGTSTQDAQPNAAITLVLSITNQGAPSVAINWTLFLEMPDQTFEVRPTHRFGNITLYRNDGTPIVYSEDDFIYNKLSTTPLGNGARIPGIVVFLVKGISADDVRRAGAHMRLEWKDVTGKTCTVFHQFTTGPNIEPLYIPGIKSLKSEEVKKLE